MLEAALPYVLALLLFGSVLALPLRLRPAGSIGAAFVLLLIEPARNAEGMRIPGPSTGFALAIFIGVFFTMFSGHWRDLHSQ
jgi:hypothetical protein